MDKFSGPLTKMDGLPTATARFYEYYDVNQMPKTTLCQISRQWILFSKDVTNEVEVRQGLSLDSRYKPLDTQAPTHGNSCHHALATLAVLAALPLNNFNSSASLIIPVFKNGVGEARLVRRLTSVQPKMAPPHPWSPCSDCILPLKSIRFACDADHDPRPKRTMLCLLHYITRYTALDSGPQIMQVYHGPLAPSYTVLATCLSTSIKKRS